TGRRSQRLRDGHLYRFGIGVDRRRRGGRRGGRDACGHAAHHWRGSFVAAHVSDRGGAGAAGRIVGFHGQRTTAAQFAADERGTSFASESRRGVARNDATLAVGRRRLRGAVCAGRMQLRLLFLGAGVLCAHTRLGAARKGTDAGHHDSNGGGWGEGWRGATFGTLGDGWAYRTPRP